MEEGELSVGEREMIQEIIKLGDKTVKDCMTPRVDAFTIPDTLSNEEVIAQVRVKRHGRVPVYGDSPDEILGVLDVKSFLLDHDEHYTERLEAPSFVPETMRALDLLRGFLTHTQRLAIVVDEFGGTEGVVTFNDIVEEVIGDAVPRGDEALYIEEIGKGKWLASGSARLDDLSELVGVDLEREGLDTIGGLIFNQLGYLPKPGTSVEIPPLRLEIRQSSRKRVLEVAVEKMARLSVGDGRMTWFLLVFCLARLVFWSPVRKRAYFLCTACACAGWRAGKIAPRFNFSSFWNSPPGCWSRLW